MPTDSRIVIIDYVNHRGERALRKIKPLKMWFGATAFHPEHQWLLDAVDVEKSLERTFALASIVNWRVP